MNTLKGTRNKLTNSMLRRSNTVSNSLGNYINNAFNQLTELNLIEKKQKENYILKKSLIERMSENLDVSFEQKVYFSSKYDFNSEVLNTLAELMTEDSWKLGSLDQIGMLSSNARARKGTSDSCEINVKAFDKKFLEGSLRKITFKTDSLASLNDFSGMFDLEQISSEYLSSSFINQSGLNNLILYFSINCLVNESFLNNENTTLVSQTSSIYSLPSFFNLLYKSSLTCSPNLRQSSSVNSLFLNNSFNFCNASCLLTVSRNDSLATSDQFIQANLFNSDFVFSGRVNVTDGIYNAPRFFNSSNFCNSASLLSIANFNTSFQLISGNFFLASSNSLGRDNVIVDILVSPNNLVYIVKSVDIYKSFDNHTSETGAFNWAQTQTDWDSVPNSTQIVVVELKWSDANDSAEMDLLVTVPSQEPAGNKFSTLHFTAELGE